MRFEWVNTVESYRDARSGKRRFTEKAFLQEIFFSPTGDFMFTDYRAAVFKHRERQWVCEFYHGREIRMFRTKKAAKAYATAVITLGS
jgi:hypothetical protein